MTVICNLSQDKKKIRKIKARKNDFVCMTAATAASLSGMSFHFVLICGEWWIFSSLMVEGRRIKFIDFFCFPPPRPLFGKQKRKKNGKQFYELGRRGFVIFIAFAYEYGIAWNLFF